MKKRIEIPRKIKEQLLLEVGLKCPIPRCDESSCLEFHHIDENPSKNTLENIIVLCPIHHRMAHSGKLSKSMCYSIKELLSRESIFGISNMNVLSTRYEYLSTAEQELRKTVFSFRVVYVGPLFLHPDWYYNVKDNVTKLPNYDRFVQETILTNRIESNNIKIFIRNSRRYEEKIKDFVPIDKRNEFKEQVLKMIDNVFGKKSNKGPQICCMDTGFLKIPIIHDSSLILADRKADLGMIASGNIYFDKKLVEREKKIFDQVFEASNRGQKIEIELLKSYVDSLWQTKF